jgi:hypothetical protein
MRLFAIPAVARGISKAQLRLDGSGPRLLVLCMQNEKYARRILTEGVVMSGFTSMHDSLSYAFYACRLHGVRYVGSGKQNDC